MPVDGQKRPLRVQTAMLMFTRRMLAPLTGAIALSLTTGGGLSVGAAPADTRQQTPTFRASINLVTTDVIARDSTNQFIADLKAGEIAVYEDGVKQELVSLVLMHGRRVFNLLSPPAEPVQAGIILPQRRPSNDATGRVFLIVVDDFHLPPRDTLRTRQWLRKILSSLIHDGDMFGIVSTGHSSISEQLTYDRQVLDSAIDRVTGGGLTPREMIEGMQTSQGPAEVRHRAHVAFATVYELVRNLEAVQNRRKAVLYISTGYDFDPFVEGRLEEQARRAGISSSTGERGDLLTAAERLRSDPGYRDQRSSQQLSATDLIQNLYDLAKAANRANATFYPIDPTGLVAGPDIDQDVQTTDWLAHTRERQHSLRTLAELTGGFAIVNTNEIDRGLQRIDNETSDYYVLGYYSNNTDLQRRTRRIEVRTTRPNVTIHSRETYSLRPERK
jgi:VWFA-related protein